MTPLTREDAIHLGKKLAAAQGGLGWSIAAHQILSHFPDLRVPSSRLEMKEALSITPPEAVRFPNKDAIGIRRMGHWGPLCFYAATSIPEIKLRLARDPERMVWEVKRDLAENLVSAVWTEIQKLPSFKKDA